MAEEMFCEVWMNEQMKWGTPMNINTLIYRPEGTVRIWSLDGVKHKGKTIGLAKVVTELEEVFPLLRNKQHVMLPVRLAKEIFGWKDSEFAEAEL